MRLVQLGVGRDQAQLQAALADAREVEPGAVVAEVQQHLVALLVHLDAQLPRGGLAGRDARLGRLDAMADAVAQQVLEGTRHAFQHRAVQLGLAAADVQLDLLAGIACRLAHDAVHALADGIELDETGAQQVVLQLACQPRLRGQFVFARLHVARQRALQRRHVADRLGQHARQFLEAGVAVELQRIELAAALLRQLLLRVHLGFGLQFQLAQLGAQALQVVVQVQQRALHLRQLGLHARAANADLTGLRGHALQQAAAHAHQRQADGQVVADSLGLGGIGETAPVDLARGLGGLVGITGRRQRVGDFGRRAGRHGVNRHFFKRHGNRLRHRLRCDLGAHGSRRQAAAQCFEGVLERIRVVLQGLDLAGVGAAGVQPRLDGRFQPVRLLAQPHGPGQPRATLEGVQRPHAGVGAAQLARVGQPVAQCGMQLLQQVAPLFLEDRVELGLDVVGQARFGFGLRQGRLRRCGSHGLLSRCRGRLRRQVGVVLDGGGQLRCDRCLLLRLVGMQPLDHVGIVRLQETGSELVQQPADVIGGAHEELGIGSLEASGALGAAQRVLQLARQAGQVVIADGGRIAGQLVGQRLAGGGHRLAQLGGPFGQAHGQLARQLVGFVQEDVEQRDADAQRADELEALVRVDRGRLGLGRRHGLDEAEEGHGFGSDSLGRLDGTVERQHLVDGAVLVQRRDGERALFRAGWRLARRLGQRLQVEDRLVVLSQLQPEVGQRRLVVPQHRRGRLGGQFAEVQRELLDLHTGQGRRRGVEVQQQVGQGWLVLCLDRFGRGVLSRGVGRQRQVDVADRVGRRRVQRQRLAMQAQRIRTAAQRLRRAIAGLGAGDLRAPAGEVVQRLGREAQQGPRRRAARGHSTGRCRAARRPRRPRRSRSGPPCGRCP